MRRASRTALARTASSVWLPIRMTRRTPNEPRKAGQTAGSKYSQLLPPLFSCCCTSGFAPKNKKARRTRRSRLYIVPDVVNMSPPTKKKGAAPSISVVLMGLRTASCPTTRSCTSRDRKNNNATSRPPTLMCSAAAAAAAAAPTALGKTSIRHTAPHVYRLVRLLISPHTPTATDGSTAKTRVCAGTSNTPPIRCYLISCIVRERLEFPRDPTNKKYIRGEVKRWRALPRRSTRHSCVDPSRLLAAHSTNTLAPNGLIGRFLGTPVHRSSSQI